MFLFNDKQHQCESLCNLSSRRRQWSAVRNTGEAHKYVTNISVIKVIKSTFLDAFQLFRINYKTFFGLK